jgi:alpha-beta hydrolase superfamily lysophospholipase
VIPERTGTIEGAGGVRLFFRIREPDDPRGRLLAVHGIGEHSGRFDRVADSALAAGLTFCAMDMRGHGRSQGRRGHARSFDRLLQDLDRFRLRSGDGGSNGPIFLLGHSLGALVVGRYVQEFGFPDLAGAILVAPFVGLAMQPPVWKLRLGEMADRLAPALTLDNGIRSEDLFRQAEERELYDRDPLVHHRISSRLWGEMRRNSAVLMRKAEQSRTPYLFQIPGDDRVVSSMASRELADRLGGESRVLEYDGAFQDLYHDAVGERASTDLVGWLRQRLDDGARAEGGGAV